MSEYEETDSLTLAVAEAMADHSLWPGAFDTMMRREGWAGSGAEANIWIGYAEAAIKAYELHQGPALTAEEVAKITQAVHDTIGSPAVIAKVEEGNALLQALKRLDLP